MTETILNIKTSNTDVATTTSTTTSSLKTLQQLQKTNITTSMIFTKDAENEI